MTLIVKLGERYEVKVSVILTPACHQNYRVNAPCDGGVVIALISLIAVQGILVFAVILVAADAVKVAES